MTEEELEVMEEAMVSDVAILETILLTARLQQAIRLHGRWSDEHRAILALMAEIRHEHKEEDRIRNRTHGLAARSDMIRARTMDDWHEALSQPSNRYEEILAAAP